MNLMSLNPIIHILQNYIAFGLFSPFFGWPLFIRHMMISSFDDFLFYGFGLVCLSRHRNYTYGVLNSLRLIDTKVRLITELSITFVTTFISWVLTVDEIATQKGICRYSVKICLFACPSLLASRSTGLFLSYPL
jgi:hypothetical protein